MKSKGYSDSHLVLVRQMADRYHIDSGELRPCVAQMLTDNNFGKKERIAYTIAVDLFNIGHTPSDIETILIDAHVASIADVKSAIQSAKSGKYKRWCCESSTMKPHLDQIRQHFCVGHDDCIWFAKHVGESKSKFKKTEDRKFEKYGWHHIVTAYEYVFYIKIRELEYMHETGTGGIIIANHDRLANIIGCTRRNVGNVATGLRDKGLIRYWPGDPTRKENRASRIQRVIPIPEPPPKYSHKLHEFEQFRRMGRID